MSSAPAPELCLLVTAAVPASAVPPLALLVPPLAFPVPPALLVPPVLLVPPLPEVI